MEEAASAADDVAATGSSSDKNQDDVSPQKNSEQTAADENTNEAQPVAVKIENESPVKISSLGTNENCEQDTVEKSTTAPVILKDVCVEAISSVGASINVSDVTSIRATAPPLQEQEEPNATGVASEKCQETSAGRDPAAPDTLVCEAKDHSCASSPVQAPVCKSEVVEIPSPEAASGTVETPAPMESPVSAPERQPPIEVGQQLVPPDPLSMTTSTSSATGAAATETNSVSNIQVSNLTVVTKKIILVDTQYDKTKEKSGDRLTKMKSYVCGTCKWCLKSLCGVCLPCVQQENAPHSLLWMVVNPKIPSGNSWKFICQEVQKCSAFKTLIEPNLKISSSDDPAETAKLGFDTPEDINEVSKVQPLVSSLPIGPLSDEVSAIFSIQDLMKATQAEQKLKRANSLKYNPGRTVYRSTAAGVMARKPYSSVATEITSSESSITTRSGNRNQQEWYVYAGRQQDSENGKPVSVKKEEHAYSTPLPTERALPSQSDVVPPSTVVSAGDMFNIWEYYEKAADSGRVKCKLCGQTRLRVISGLKFHVAAKHNVKVDLHFSAKSADPQNKTKAPPQKVCYKRRAARINNDSSDDFSEPDSNDETGAGKDYASEERSDGEENISADDECILEASMDDLKSMQEAEISEAIRLGTLRSKVRIRPEIFSQSFQLKVGRFLSDGGSMKALSDKLDLTVDTLRTWRRAHEHKTVEDKLKKQKTKPKKSDSSSQKPWTTDKTAHFGSPAAKPVNTIGQPSKTNFMKDDSSTAAAGMTSSGGNAITFQFNPNNRPVFKGGPTAAPRSTNPFNMPVVFPPPPAKSMNSPIPIQPKAAGTVQRMIHQGRGGGEAFIASNANVITAQKQQINTGVVMPGFTPGHSAAINTHLPYNSKPPIVSLKNFVSSNLHDKFGDDLIIIYDKGASDISDEETDYDDDLIPKAVVQESLPFLCNYCREIFRTPEILQHHLYDCPKRKSQLATSNTLIGSTAMC